MRNFDSISHFTLQTLHHTSEDVCASKEVFPARHINLYYSQLHPYVLLRLVWYLGNDGHQIQHG